MILQLLYLMVVVQGVLTQSVRLVDGVHFREGRGRVEVQFNGVWGTVCDYQWDNNDARVVCRQLGFDPENARATGGAMFGEGTGQIFLDRVNCNGAENNLGECSHRGVGVHYCGHHMDAGVICTNVSFQVRLVNGGHPHRGRVEVQFKSEWSTVCSNSWDNNDARVVCRQLGFPHENAVVTTNAAFGEGTGQIFLDDVHCSGAENNLDECNYRFVGFRYCGHYEDAGVICTNDILFSQVRLVNGSHPHQGRVEVQVNGEWGTVCADGWDYVDARVICRQLGFKHGNPIATRNAVFGEGIGLILSPRFGCNGAESSLNECNYKLSVSCKHTEEAGVVCTNDTTISGLRLVNGGHLHQGRLEVQVDGIWGTVCDNNWDKTDARVVCRQLGFPHENAIATVGSAFGEETGTIILNDVGCNETENNFGECSHSGVGIHYCSDREDAGVICTNVSLQVRLVNGGHLHRGRVEVQLNGVWSSVCDRYWSEDDARVVCRQLGFPYENAVATYSASFGEGTGQIILDPVNCKGDEKKIGECSFGVISVYNCGHDYDSGVICTNDTLFSQIRLVNGSHPQQGRVEVQVNGEWGTVCFYDWDKYPAKAVCRQLGFPHENAVATFDTLFGEAGLILSSYFYCYEDETGMELSECNYEIDDICGHNYSAGVMCTNDTLKIRLVNGSHPQQGRMEVQVNGEWGTVCDDWLDNNNARVVCRQLGFDPVYAIATGNAAFGAGTGPIFLGYVHCYGYEDYINECDFLATASSANWCEHTRDAGFMCTNDTTIRGLRLVNGSHPHQGRVEIQVDAVWGRVCDYRWDINDAKVVCRQLGFESENATTTWNAEFGKGTGPTFLDEVDCNGTENTLNTCSYRFSQDNYCYEDAGVICSANIYLQVRLVNGSHPHQGRVEVQVDGVWGTVCDWNWDYRDAKVVCRQLGFPHENAVPTGKGFGKGTGQTLLDFFCNGAENNVDECNRVGVHNCGHDGYAGVICTNDTTIRGVRLVNGSHPHQGRVEVQVDGVWGTVCDEWWDNNDASVVCRQLGFDPESATATWNAVFGEGTGPIFLTDFDCNGVEINLSECSHSGVEDVVFCSHNKDAGVICTSGMDKGALITTQQPDTEMTSDKPTVTFQWDVTETEIYIQEDSKYLDLSVKVTREGTTKKETVDIQVNSITATEGSDFKVPRYIEFDTDDDTKTVRIEIINDDAKEGVESFQLILYHDSSAGNIGDPSKITVYIQDNDGYAKEHTGFESQNTTFECDIKNSNASQEEWSNYTTVTLYMQDGNNLQVEDADKLDAISASNTFIDFENDDISITFELISSNSGLLKAKVTIYDLELHYSGYFWCVFRRPDDPYTSFLAYEKTLMSVSPCVEPTSALATSENECIGLTELNMVNVSDENVAAVADALAQVTDRSDGDGIFTPTEIDQVGDVITSIVAVGDGSEEVTGSVVESISNLIGAVDTKVPPESQVSNNTTTRIANSLEQQVSLSLKVNNDVKIVDSNVAVQASKPKPDTITGIGIAILSEPTTVFSNSTTETILENDNSHPPAIIYLPRNTVRRIQDESNKEIGFIFLVYRNDFLFPSNKTNLVVDGPILAASVTEGGELRKQNTLSAPVEYETRGQQEEVSSNDAETQKHKIEARVSCHYPTPQCVFYNYSIREWSPEGCRYLGRHNETGNHQCECEHLTNFAVLVYHGKKPVVSEALDIISKLGCGLSITALTLTVILFTFFKKLRRKARTITVHLCLSLIGLYAVFLIAVDWVCPKVVCTITAALLHYFVLTSMAWMAVEARFLYIKLVRVFDPENAGFVTRCAVLAWGVPLVIVAISLGISFGTGSDAYQNNQYCFPKVGLVVYLAVLLPIAISLVHNIITFGIIMKSIFRQRPGQRSRRSRAEKKILIERVRHSITITCLLGLTWILGFLAIDSAALAFQWLFCIMNSFQGVFIFIFMCLLQDEVKTVLFSSCLVESRSSSQTGSGFSTGDKSTAGGHSSSDFRSVDPSSHDYDSGTISTNDGGYSNRGIEMNDQS